MRTAAAPARVGCEYHDSPGTILGLMPLTPDSWSCSCSLPGLRPRRKEPWVPGNHTPQPHVEPQSQGPGP